MKNFFSTLATLAAILSLLTANVTLAQTAAELNQWKTFKAMYGSDLLLEWDSQRGTPALIYNLGFSLEGPKTRDRNQIDRVIRGFIAQHQDLFGINPSDLELTHTVLLEDGDWYLTYLQSYRGLRVIGGSFGINVNYPFNVWQDQIVVSLW